MGCCFSKSYQDKPLKLASQMEPSSPQQSRPPPSMPPGQLQPPLQQSPETRAPPSNAQQSRLPPSFQTPTSTFPRSPENLPEELLQKVTAAFVDYFIMAMESFLHGLQTKDEKGKPVIMFARNSGAEMDRIISDWKSFVEGGEKLFEFVDKGIQRKESVHTQLWNTRQALAEILQCAGNFHWTVGILSIIGYMLVQIGQVSDNRNECIELLKEMVNLAECIKGLIDDMPEEGRKLRDALLTLFEGSVMCTTLLKSKKFSRILRAPIDSAGLINLRRKIKRHYRDLHMTLSTKINHNLLKQLRRNNSFPGGLGSGASTRGTRGGQYLGNHLSPIHALPSMRQGTSTIPTSIAWLV